MMTHSSKKYFTKKVIFLLIHITELVSGVNPVGKCLMLLKFCSGYLFWLIDSACNIPLLVNSLYIGQGLELNVSRCCSAVFSTTSNFCYQISVIQLDVLSDARYWGPWGQLRRETNICTNTNIQPELWSRRTFTQERKNSYLILIAVGFLNI